jgi:hypothetical protein
MPDDAATGLSVKETGYRELAPWSFPPVWLVGLSNTSFGPVGGFIAFTLPQALAAQRVRSLRIAPDKQLDYSGRVRPPSFRRQRPPTVGKQQPRQAYRSGRLFPPVGDDRSSAQLVISRRSSRASRLSDCRCAQSQGLPG